MVLIAGCRYSMILTFALMGLSAVFLAIAVVYAIRVDLANPEHNFKTIMACVAGCMATTGLLWVWW